MIQFSNPSPAVSVTWLAMDWNGAQWLTKI
jgi:hypothetical protein